jgi:hypothetical protein
MRLDEIRVALAQDKTRKMPEFQMFARIAQRHLGAGWADKSGPPAA